MSVADKIAANMPAPNWTMFSAIMVETQSRLFDPC